MRYLALVLLPVLIAACAGPPGVSPSADPASPTTEESVEVAVPGGILHGTLLLPAGDGPFPAALIIAGSGPTDRDGNSLLLPGANNSLKLLAEGLARRGIATLRYDKRGIGASAAAGPREADLRFGMNAEDAGAWISELQADPRLSDVSIIGHSEGSLVGMLAAQISEIAAFVSVAGPGRPAADILREQLRDQLPSDLWAESERILRSLLVGETVEDIPAALMALYRPSVQPYLISWLRLDPAVEIGRIEAPVLIVQGTTDVQVKVADAELLAAARPDSEVAIIEGMNHILKLVPADPSQQQASYSNPDLPVAPAALDRISSFLLAATR